MDSDKDSAKPQAIGKYVLGVAAGVLAAWMSGNARGADPMLASYSRHGYPGCLSPAELNGRLTDVAEVAHLSRNVARAEIATFIDQGVPPVLWTRFALYPDSLKSWSGPAAPPCPTSPMLIGAKVSPR